MGEVRNDRLARLIGWQRFVLTPEGKSEFLQRLGESGDLDEVCREMDLPRVRVLAFVASQAELSEAAKAVLELKAHQMVAEGLEIVDDREGDPDASSRRVRADYRLKVAEKWAKGMYGAKGVDVGAMAEGITEALQRISERRRREKLVEQGAGGVAPGDVGVGERLLAAPSEGSGS